MKEWWSKELSVSTKPSLQDYDLVAFGTDRNEFDGGTGQLRKTSDIRLCLGRQVVPSPGISGAGHPSSHLLIDRFGLLLSTGIGKIGHQFSIDHIAGTNLEGLEGIEDI